MAPSKITVMPGRDYNQQESRNCFKFGNVLLHYSLTFQQEYLVSSWICVTQLEESSS